jgi:iron complex outermembrane receptor protein
VEPEELTAYEIGFKTDLLDRKLRFNGAAFKYDYKDLQVFTVVNASQFPGVSGVLQVLDNAANAKVQGIELEATAVPIDNLQLSVAGAYLDSEYEDFIVAISPTVTEDRSGSRLIGAPKFDLTASAQYDLELPFGTVSPRVELVHKGSRYYDTAQRDALAFLAPSYDLINLSVIVADVGDRIKARAYVDNVTDERFIVEAVDVRALGFRQIYYGEPRTYGLELTYKF